MKRLLAALAAAALVAALSAAGSAGSAESTTYLILYKQQSVPTDAARAIERAGGTLTFAYGQIGVAVARSDAAGFRERLAQDARVEAVAATGAYGVRLEGVEDADAGPTDDAPATDTDTLSPLQWDMRQIHAPEAHAITGGSRTVLAGDLDTGVDWSHPDLAANVDFANSTSCVGGVPNQAPAAWLDDLGHGTHTAGTIAAAATGIGIVGVAPNVRLASVSTADPAGFFYPEAVVCAFVWAGSHHFDVTNNSWFADPFQFNCHNDPETQAIFKAEHRAIRYAMNQGVTVVASAGNSNFDLTRDAPEGNECVRIPSEIEGVITVTANGNLKRKAFYSNFGVGVVNVTAPGGDSMQITPEATNGRVLSTWPSYIACARRATDPGVPGAVWCYQQGTSMATPHVTGVAALLISHFGDLRPQQVQAYIEQTADPLACDEPACYGGAGYNAYYGHGQVNALSAVAR
jgi:subtilisin family serine protease